MLFLHILEKGSLNLHSLVLVKAILTPMLQVIGAVGFMDQRLDIPSDTDPQWASMIENCWDR